MHVSPSHVPPCLSHVPHPFRPLPLQSPARGPQTDLITTAPPDLCLDRSTFDKLALEHIDALYGVALSLTKNPNDASDLVQDTYARAIRAAHTFQEKGGGMRSWLLTILHNAFYNQAKRKSLAPVLMDEIVAADPNQNAPDEAPPAWDLRSLDWEQVDERIKKAIDDLTPEHRDVLLLWGVQGLKYREIAQVLDIPIGTVMSRLHRARKLVADSLEAFRDDLGYSGQEAARRPIPRSDA